MPRLEGKNILMIIPKDYYEEDQLEIPKKIFKEEGADVYVASTKLKEAVGMKGGRFMPDVMIVDAMEGVIGDSYVTGGKGTRQIKGVFHGTVVIGGNGARKYLWKEKLLRLLLVDRFKANMIVSAIGTAVPCLGEARLFPSFRAAATPTAAAPSISRPWRSTIVLIASRIWSSLTSTQSSTYRRHSSNVIEPASNPPTVVAVRP